MLLQLNSLFLSYLVFMVGISRLLLFKCCIGKESLERAFGLDLSVEVAEMTSAENFEKTFKVATLKHKK